MPVEGRSFSLRGAKARGQGMQRNELSLGLHDKRIARAPAAARIARHDTFLEEVSNVATGRVLRGFCERRVFRAGQLAFERAQQTIENTLTIALVSRVSFSGAHIVAST